MGVFLASIEPTQWLLWWLRQTSLRLLEQRRANANVRSHCKHFWDNRKREEALMKLPSSQLMPSIREIKSSWDNLSLNIGYTCMYSLMALSDILRVDSELSLAHLDRVLSLLLILNYFSNPRTLGFCYYRRSNVLKPLCQKAYCLMWAGVLAETRLWA